MGRVSKTSPTRIRTAQRRQQVIALRTKGMRLADIGAELGISKQAVFKHLEAVLQNMQREGLDELVTLELERLDALHVAVWSDAMSGDEKAVARALDIQARRAKLLGLDSPVQHQVGGRDGPPIPVIILRDEE